jgi:hypothetical protein
MRRSFSGFPRTGWWSWGCVWTSDAGLRAGDEFFSKKEESSFSEEKEAKRLLFLVRWNDTRQNCKAFALIDGCSARS